MPKQGDHALTWGDVARFAKAEKLDQDEYFMLGLSVSVNQPIWQYDVEIKGVVIWWSPGTNEGYYVQIGILTAPTHRDIRHGKRELTNAATGKYWTPEAASRAADMLTRFIYDLPISPAV